MNDEYTLFDHVPLGIIVCSGDQEVRFWNSCMEDWTGISRREISGKPLPFFFPRLSEARYRKRLDLLLEGGPPIIFSYQLNGCLLPHRDTHRMERVQHITATSFLGKDQERLALLAVEDRSEVSTRIRSARAELAKRIETEETLRKAIAEKEFLMRELNHRVKNNLSMILSMISLQQETIESESFRSTLEDLDGRIRSFSLLHEMLYKSPDTTNIRLDIYIGNIVREMFESLRNPDSGAVLETEIEALELPFQSALYLGLIASEALTNAMKYAINNRGGSFIAISVKALPKGTIELRVRDDGPGFRPGINPMSGDSLGIKLIQLLTTELKGELKFNSGGNSGEDFGVELVVRFSTGTGST